MVVSFLVLRLFHLSVQIKHFKVCHQEVGTDCCFISAFVAYSFVSTNKKYQRLSPGSGDRSYNLWEYGLHNYQYKF